MSTEVVTKAKAGSLFTGTWLRTVTFAIIGAACYAAAFPPLEWALLAWVAPVAWLLMVRDKSPRQRFWFMFLSGYIGTVLLVHWLSSLFSTLSLMLWMVPAAYFGVWGVTATLAAAAAPALRIVWPAVAWAAIEYFRCELAPLAFSFGGLGYSQANWIGFRLASGVGVYGVSALMVLLASLLIETWNRPGRFMRVAAIGALCAVFAGTVVSTSSTAPDGSTIFASAILQQLKQDDDIGAWDALPVRENTADVDLIIWPELTLTDDPRQQQASWFIDMIVTDARHANWGVMFGAMDFYGDNKGNGAPYHNSIFFLNDDKRAVKIADKNQPIQLMLDGDPASDIAIFQPAFASRAIPKAGVGICYDGCFQRFSRRMVSSGAEYLVFPAMNLENWGTIQHRQHQRMFQMRAAETGRTVLVAAVSGPTFAANPNGTVAKEAPLHETYALRVNVKAAKQTVFNAGGWLFGYICMAGYVLGVAVVAVNKFRSRGKRDDAIGAQDPTAAV